MRPLPALLLAAVLPLLPAAEPVSLPTAHSIRRVEGWTVRVDDRLLGPQAELGARCLKVLEARLIAITLVVPEPALDRLRQVVIQLDLDHGALKAMQYHPDVGWLTRNGYAAQLAKCVHIPRADDLLSPTENHRMPWVILHELAHAFHDQVVGFAEPRVRAAWESFRDSGKYATVLTSQGRKRPHYGLTDPKEYFAEMTEAYFGSNDFFPFVSGELREAEPATYALLRELWGPHPGYTAPEPARH
jgi:hypothetical protein